MKEQNKIQLMNAERVARMLDCSVSFVLRERSIGNLVASVKLGNGEKGWRWTEEDVWSYVEKQRVFAMGVLEVPEKQQRWRQGPSRRVLRVM